MSETDPCAAGGGDAPPVLIIGAARSGTKILRNLVAAHPALSAVPYDINYVWMFGHYGRRDDELGPEDVTLRIGAFIRDYIGRFAAPDTRIVEKTVGNALRVPFVDGVYPGARYVHLVRDGRDVAASARIQWRTPAAPTRLAAKLRRFPLRVAWPYAAAYLREYLRLRLARQPAVRSWGPRYRGMLDEVGALDLLEICARQWTRSVAKATADLAARAPDRTIAVRYEDLVADPPGETERILDFVGLRMTPQVEVACGKVTGGSVGEWTSRLSPDEARRVQAIEQVQLDRWGYA